MIRTRVLVDVLEFFCSMLSHFTFVGLFPPVSSDNQSISPCSYSLYIYLPSYDSSSVYLYISLLKFLPQDAFGFHLVLFFLVALTFSLCPAFDST